MDKNRKRGERIAQKNTYRHHAADNGPQERRAQHNCWSCEGNYCKKCKECRRWFQHKSGDATFDNELREYLENASVCREEGHFIETTILPLDDDPYDLEALAQIHAVEACANMVLREAITVFIEGLQRRNPHFQDFQGEAGAESLQRFRQRVLENLDADTKAKREQEWL